MAGLLTSLIVIAVLVIAVIFLTSWVRFIPNRRAGLVEKRFGGRGSLRSGFIALAGEAGFQPQVLRGGIHLLTPFQYTVHMVPLVTIPQGKIGYLFARDGRALSPTLRLAFCSTVTRALRTRPLSSTRCSRTLARGSSGQSSSPLTSTW